MRRNVQLGGLLLAIALVIGACGGGGGSKTASPTVASDGSSDSSTGSSSSGDDASLEACKLSEDDVSDVVGFTMKKQPGSGSSNCTFSSESTDSEHLGATVTFNVSPFSGSEAETKIAADAIASAFDTTPVDIPGVGDKSFFIDAGIVGELVVFAGKTQVTVAIGGLSDDTSDRKDQLIALAKKLLA